MALTDLDETGDTALSELTSLAIASASACLKGMLPLDWPGGRYFWLLPCTESRPLRPDRSVAT